MKHILILLFLFSALFAISQPAVNKSGVKTNTISLPTGPGSIEGLGESFQPSLNTGQANYGVNFALPAGTAGHAPNIGISYNGGSGNGTIGYGWSMNLPAIQRQCDKGIPLYVDENNGLDDDYDGQVDETDELDVFLNEMKEELVLTADGYYFCENEGAFIRYKRIGEHWEAHLPDGTLMEFGLTPNSRIIDSETNNTFSWLLERMTDTNGNTITYTYISFDCNKDFNQKYLSKVEYGAGAAPWDAFHFVQFEYEDRFDWFEDARAGFPIRTGMRLGKVYIGTQGVELEGHLAGDFNKDGTTDYLNRIYELNYTSHPHWSLLAEVIWVGGDGRTPYPPISFQYTNRSPKDTIVVGNKIIGEANAPFQLMDNPLVDLVDMNGDGLPDLLKTERFGGSHSVYLNEGEQDGGTGNKVITWKAVETVQSEDGLAWQINLEDGQNAIAHLADMDADGLSDLVYKTGFGDVYYFKNKGENAWGSRQLMNTAFGQSAPPSPFSAANVKTADLNFDKHIDIIQSIPTAGGFYYRIWFNLGNEQYSQAVTVVQESGFDLAANNVHIADFNGDRVPDLVSIGANGITVTAGLGHGQFADPMFVLMPDFVLSPEQVEKASLQDLNGDGLVDLIIDRAAPNELWYWLNLGNYSLDKQRFLVGMPSIFSLNPTTRWADMNGNGTTDFVYADPFAFPRLQIVDIGELIGAVPSPNLLQQVDNGIGQKTILEYETSTKYLLQDRAAGENWKYTLPFPVNVVAKATISDGMGNDYETEFTYHDGYYDGQEKEFRGFGRVESREIGDESAPDLIMAYEFDTGANAEALKGKQLSAEARTVEGDVFFKEFQTWRTRTLYESSLQDGKKVTFPYSTQKRKEILEKGNGTPVDLQWAYKYDNFGNLTEQFEYGRMDEGWDDERKSKTVFSAAFEDGQNRWIINKPIEQRTTDEKDTLIAHALTYYDQNIDLGKLDKGNPTRIENWVDSSKYIVSVRNDYDEYGNIVATYDPLYGVQLGHYRTLRYDPFFHAFPEEEIIHTGKAEPATLNYNATYDYGYGTVLTSTEFNGHTTTYKYDAFARLSAITKPLDSLPTMEYDYILGQKYQGGRTLNWIESRQLDGSAGDGYLHTRTFVDGLGREIMTRAEGEEMDQIVVTNTVQFNKRKQAHKTYLPYFETGTLDFNDPTFNTGFTEHFYDELMRPIRINQPAAPEGVVFSQIQYQPLIAFAQDEEQTNPDSKHFGCGTRSVMDGLTGKNDKPRLRENYQLVKLSDEGEAIDSIVEWKTEYEYDLLDNLVRFTDAQYNQKLFDYDALSRKTFNNDPNRGISYYQYDDASNLILTIDAKQQQIRYDYDGLNRLTAEYYNTTDTIADVRYHYDLPSSALDRGTYWQGGSSKIKATNTLGYLSWVEDQSGEEHNAYDARGRAVWTLKRITDGKVLRNFYTGYAYDAMDRVTQLTYPDASQVNYEYNSRGLLEAVPNVISQYDYNPAGQNASLTLACGTKTSYTHDHRLRLQQLKTTRLRDSLLLQDLDYQFDGLMNITAIQDNRDSVILDKIGTDLELQPLEARKYKATQSFIYDNLYRLTQAANTTVYGTINYRYDRTGNMLRKNANLLEANPIMDLGKMENGGTAGAWNRIGRSTTDLAGPNAITSTQNGAMIFTYDANGNMLSDYKATYDWDVKDRLTQIKSDSSDGHYTYDYTDARKLKFVNGVLKASYINRFVELRDSQIVKYVNAGVNRIAQIKEDTTFFLHDHIGSTSLSLNDSAKVVEQLVKHPYGLIRKSKHIGFEADYTFTGKEQDKESDNYYFEARYYNPIIGRFKSTDPLSNSAENIAISSYAYVGNSPLSWIDFDGLNRNIPQISTPVPNNFRVSGSGGSRRATGTIRGVRVIIRADRRGNVSSGSDGITSYGLNFVPLNARGNTLTYRTDSRGRITRFRVARLRLTIRTTYRRGVNTGSQSAYGRGTTRADRAAGNTSLRFHEGSHGTDALRFLRRNALPQFQGRRGMTEAQFNQAWENYQQAVQDYNDKMDRENFRNVDCAGTPHADCNGGSSGHSHSHSHSHSSSSSKSEK